ncbi:MAG: 4Fe-4S dicluster domain-containing protein [Candidatus Aminicenantes bacterium]|nr:4Fe-4S dicluster domain-containing protein [Candidatus Aminicenantes bacterium]
MAHRTAKTGYQKLVKRLNKFPQGAPPSALLFEILKVLMSEKEAALLALVPIKPFTAKTAAKAWKTSLSDAQKTLDALAGRALLIDAQGRKNRYYVLPPPMAGFFEFSMMRLRGDVDQKLLAKLYYEYITVEEDFIKALFTQGETQLGRVFVSEPVLSNENALHVLDYERASEVVKTASHRGISLCYCRHKMDHAGRACDAPQDICMTFNTTAAALARHGYARTVDVAEGLALLDEARGRNLVQFGENVRNRVSFICNCCGCCCEAMIAQRRFGLLNPVHTTNFLPVVDTGACTGCSECAVACPVEAMALVSANDPLHPKKKKAVVDESLCLGCGVCVRVCRSDALSLVSRPERVITPLNSVHKAVLMAIERGKLQNLIFDNQALRSHRAMAAVLGVILRLPPLKQALASKQMKSRYLETLIARLRL